MPSLTRPPAGRRDRTLTIRFRGLEFIFKHWKLVHPAERVCGFDHALGVFDTPLLGRADSLCLESLPRRREMVLSCLVLTMLAQFNSLAHDMHRFSWAKSKNPRRSFKKR